MVKIVIKADKPKFFKAQISMVFWYFLYQGEHFCYHEIFSRSPLDPHFSVLAVFEYFIMFYVIIVFKELSDAIGRQKFKFSARKYMKLHS